MPFGGALTAGVGVGSGLLNGIFGSKAADKAAKAQAQAQQQVIDNTKAAVQTGQAGITNAQQTIGDATAGGQKLISDATTGGVGLAAAGTTAANQTLTDSQKQQLGLYQPFIDSGTSSLKSLQDLSGPGGPLADKFSFNPSDLANDPGYKFTLQQGEQAIQRAAAAQGGLFSAGTSKALAGYTTGTADQYFNDAFSRARNTFQTNQSQALARIGTLQGLAGMGLSGTAAGAGAVGQTSSQMASNSQQGSQFGANLLFGGGTAGAGIGLQGAGLNLGGAEAGANLQLGGAQVIGNALTNKGNAQAAGTVGSTNSWLSALNQGTGSILNYFARPGGGGGSTGGSLASGAPLGSGSTFNAGGTP